MRSRAKINNLQFIESNNMVRVASMLNQWALTQTAGTLLTNYGQAAWEYTSVGGLSPSTLAGPPSSFTYKTNWTTPSFTNDNLQLLIPQTIRIARNDLYMAYYDQSIGVHNPNYVEEFLDDAAARVSGQFANANFSANTVAGFAPLTVTFTNLGNTANISGYSWTFGDGLGTANSANPSYLYTTPGLYTVTFTANLVSGGTETLIKTNYIRVLAPPTISFVADNTTVGGGTTVNFTSTSTGTNSVFRWAWYRCMVLAGHPIMPRRADRLPLALFTRTQAPTLSGWWPIARVAPTAAIIG